MTSYYDTQQQQGEPPDDPSNESSFKSPSSSRSVGHRPVDLLLPAASLPSSNNNNNNSSINDDAVGSRQTHDDQRQMMVRPAGGGHHDAHELLHHDDDGEDDTTILDASVVPVQNQDSSGGLWHSPTTTSNPAITTPHQDHYHRGMMADQEQASSPNNSAFLRRWRNTTANNGSTTNNHGVIVDNSPWHRRNRGTLLWTATILLLVLLAIIATLSFTLDNRGSRQKQQQSSPSSDSPNLLTGEERAKVYRELVQFIERHSISDPTTLLNPNSPQSQTLDYMSQSPLTRDLLLLQLQSSSSDVLGGDVLVWPLAQRYVVHLFYFGNGGESTRAWGNRYNWLDPTISECRWEGIGCKEEEDGEINVLSFDAFGLTGFVPEEIGLLTKLEFLDLGLNRLEGTLPTTVYAKLTDLRLLNLTRGTNQIEVDFSDHHHDDVDYYGEDDQQERPRPPSLRSLTNLQSLLLSGPATRGNASNVLPALSNLRELVLVQTQVSGPVVELALSHLPHLVHLLATHSSTMTGTIPSSIFTTRTKNLISFQLYFLDQMHGTIPSPPRCVDDDDGSSSSYCSNLKHFALAGMAQLVGTLPSELAKCSNIEIFQLDSVDVTGTIPVEFGMEWIQWRRLILSHTLLEGTIPDYEWQHLSSTMTYVDLSENRNLNMSAIPAWMGNVPPRSTVKLLRAPSSGGSSSNNVFEQENEDNNTTTSNDDDNGISSHPQLPDTFCNRTDLDLKYFCESIRCDCCAIPCMD